MIARRAPVQFLLCWNVHQKKKMVWLCVNVLQVIQKGAVRSVTWEICTQLQPYKPWFQPCRSRNSLEIFYKVITAEDTRKEETRNKTWDSRFSEFLWTCEHLRTLIDVSLCGNMVSEVWIISGWIKSGFSLFLLCGKGPWPQEWHHHQPYQSQVHTSYTHSSPPVFISTSPSDSSTAVPDNNRGKFPDLISFLYQVLVPAGALLPRCFRDRHQQLWISSLLASTVASHTRLQLNGRSCVTKPNNDVIQHDAWIATKTWQLEEKKYWSRITFHKTLYSIFATGATVSFILVHTGDLENITSMLLQQTQIHITLKKEDNIV